jgi:hypothetical protein
LIHIKRVREEKDDGPDKGATHSSPHLSTGVIFFIGEGIFPLSFFKKLYL